MRAARGWAASCRPGGLFPVGEGRPATGITRLLVLAPASVQEAVEMVMAAFPLAEKYLNPVMILGDA